MAPAHPFEAQNDHGCNSFVKRRPRRSRSRVAGPSGGDARGETGPYAGSVSRRFSRRIRTAKDSSPADRGNSEALERYHVKQRGVAEDGSKGFDVDQRRNPQDAEDQSADAAEEDGEHGEHTEELSLRILKPDVAAV